MKFFLTEKIHPEAVALLQLHGQVVQGTSVAAEDIIAQAQSCQGLLVRSAYITADVLGRIPSLKSVAKHGIGVDNIDVAAATELGVQVLNAPLSNLNAVAEHALALMLGLAKNLPLLDRITRETGFAWRSQFTNLELSGKTLGLIGFGKIAQRLTRKASGLDMHVLASDPYAIAEDAEALGVELVGLDELLARSDFVSLHVPLLESTRHLIDASALGKMKPTAFLINAARGPIMDEAALIKALSTGVIAGAGLDVFDPEPPEPDNPLFALENVIISPHNAALTDQALLAMALDSAQGLIDYLEGLEPLYKVNSIEAQRAR